MDKVVELVGGGSVINGAYYRIGNKYIFLPLLIGTFCQPWATCTSFLTWTTRCLHPSHDHLVPSTNVRPHVHIASHTQQSLIA